MPFIVKSQLELFDHALNPYFQIFIKGLTMKSLNTLNIVKENLSPLSMYFNELSRQ